MDWLTHVITPLPEHFDGKKPSVFWKNETRKTTQIHAVMFPSKKKRNGGHDNLDSIGTTCTFFK